MGQSLVKNYIHIVFSTKYRQPLIQPPVEEELHAYLGGICKKLECPPIKVGGYTVQITIVKIGKKEATLTYVIKDAKGKQIGKDTLTLKSGESSTTQVGDASNPVIFFLKLD